MGIPQNIQSRFYREAAARLGLSDVYILCPSTLTNKDQLIREVDSPSDGARVFTNVDTLLTYISTNGKKGDVVHVFPGDFNLTANATLECDGVEFIGHGDANLGGNFTITVNGTANCFRNLTLDCHLSFYGDRNSCIDTTHTGKITLTADASGGANETVLKGCRWLSGCATSNILLSPDDGDLSDVVVDNCHLYTTGAVACISDGGSAGTNDLVNVIIENCTFVATNASGTYIDVGNSNASNGHMQGNMLGTATNAASKVGDIGDLIFLSNHTVAGQSTAVPS